MKTKTLITKIDATTIEVKGQRLSMPKDSEIGTDYYVYEFERVES